MSAALPVADAVAAGARAQDRVKRVGGVCAHFRPEDGGRLAALTYNGVELVLPPGRVPGFYGDTFWPSPQSLFDWPPPPVLDAEPYRVLSDSPEAITMASAPDPQSGLQVTKQIRLTASSVDFELTVRNVGAWPNWFAPWQVTRASRRGLLVWGAGQPFTDSDRMDKQREDPGCWFIHEQAGTPFPGMSLDGDTASVQVGAVDRVCKLFTDSQGWLAHVHDGVLFLRTFPDLRPAQMAPRQAELELFFSPTRDYIELENQGSYRPLAPGAVRRYEVQWRFARLDPETREDEVTPELLSQIAALRGCG